MMPTINEIQYLLEVEKCLNFTRAAEKLGISQPTLSMAISKLEKKMGITLVLRFNNGVQLTRSGKYLCQKGKDLIQGWNHFYQEIEAIQRDSLGVFKFGSSGYFANLYLPQIIPQLFQVFPKTHFKFDFDYCKNISYKVISFQLDVGLVISAIPHPDLVIYKIREDRISLWCHKDQKKKTIKDLKIFYYPEVEESLRLINNIEKKMGINLNKIEVPNFKLLATLVSQGTGAAFLPDSLGEMDSDCRLYSEDGLFFGKRDDLCLIFRQDLQNPPGMKKIIHLIKDQLLNLGSGISQKRLHY